jgi:hypothetical protein
VRALPTIALGALLLGCQGKEPDSCLTSTAQAPFINGERFVAAGGSVDLEVVLPAPKVCTSGLPAATGVEVEVTDPEGNPVAHTVGAVSANLSRGYSVHVAFAVAAVGPHFVRARFEPSLGVVQTFVEGAVDRTAQAWEVAPAGWESCEGVVALRDGRLGCRRFGGLAWSPGGGTLSGELREGGDGLWVLQGTTVQRFELRGGQSWLGAAEVPVVGVPMTLSLYDARGDSVLLGPPLTRVRALDGGLAVQRLDDGLQEDRLALVHGAAFSRDGGVRAVTVSGLCEVNAPPAPALPTARCESALVSALSVSDEGLWLRQDGAGQALVLLTRGGGRASLDISPLIPAGDHEQVPLLRAGAQVFLPVLRGDRLGLEAWRGPPDTTILSADDRVVFAVRGSLPATADGGPGVERAFLSRRPAP